MEERCHECHETKSFCTCNGDALWTKWAESRRYQRKLDRMCRNAYTIESIEIKRNAKKDKRLKARRLKKRGH